MSEPRAHERMDQPAVAKDMKRDARAIRSLLLLLSSGAGGTAITTVNLDN